jgi:hypothetical protein
MSVTLPFLKKAGMEILQAQYATSAAAATEIPAALTAYYAKSHADVASQRAAEIAEAGTVLADVYSRNVFPELGVTWGTYPDNRGHPLAGGAGKSGFPGCFRCHDGEHATASGEKITNNCFRCHYPSAVGETKPEILELLGVDKLLKGLRKD